MRVPIDCIAGTSIGAVVPGGMKTMVPSPPKVGRLVPATHPIRRWQVV
jgi:hypothetical protein